MQSKYSAGVYIVQATQYGMVPTLALLDKTTNKYNKLDAKFDMEVLEQKEKSK